MTAGDDVRRFVRDVLGCACSDEDFRQVSLRPPAEREGPGGLAREELEIGRRLLVDVISGEAFARDGAAFERLVRKGIRLRDARGLNRYHVVLLVEDPRREPATLRQRWAVAAGLDVRAHLHVVAQTDWPRGS